MTETDNSKATRRDSYGQLLKNGEYERQDGVYEYRYLDQNKDSRSLYAGTLKELRKLEKTVADKLWVEPLPYGGSIPVNDLIARYIATKRGKSANTMVGYRYSQNFVRRFPIGEKRIMDVHMADAKQFVVSLFDLGYAYCTISQIRGVLKCAFHMAYADEIIAKNPFDFTLDLIPNKTKRRAALTPKQQKLFMDYVAQHEYYRRYWDEINVLLYTGMRVAEFCGLTRSDLDFRRRRIRVDHQLIATAAGGRRVGKTKSESGCRYIPMCDSVYVSLRNILANRPKGLNEVMIDGYGGFLLLDRKGEPRTSFSVEHVLERIWNKYNEENIVSLQKVTPHVLRHTFCTNMFNAGMDLKSLQYLMGHAEASTTMNIYTHNSYEKAKESMEQILGFSEVEPPKHKKAQ